MRPASRLLTGTGVVVFIHLLIGCATLTGPPKGDVGDLINSALEAEASAESSTLDFGLVVDGDWTAMVIICGGTARGVVERLGFEWDSLPDPNDPAFLSMAIFATEDVVVEYFVAGKDDGWVDHWAFTFCSIPAEPNFDDVQNAQIRIDREQAVIQFARMGSGNLAYWYVPSSELLRLASAE